MDCFYEERKKVIKERKKLVRSFGRDKVSLGRDGRFEKGVGSGCETGEV